MAALPSEDQTQPASGRPRGIRARLAAIGWNWILLVPLVAAIVFVVRFSSAMPLTDEWLYTKAIVALQSVDLHTRAGLGVAIGALPHRFGDHWVVVPFLIYWPVAEWTHFDSRWFIYMTVACFALEALLFRRYLVRSALAALPVALLLFCPSHYMEFLWGWQLTVTLSIAFPAVGLFLIDRIPVAGPLGVKLLRLAGGLGLCLLGTLSSAGGLFGFPCAFLLLALKPFRWIERIVWLLVVALATALTYAKLMYEPDHHLHIGSRALGCVLTALGGTIWGTPVGVFEFGLERLSLTGLVILACLAAVVVRAAIVGALPRLALALSICLLGLFCMAAIAMARQMLGNWHIQSVLLAPCGAYAAAYLLWKEDRSRWSAVPFFTLCLVLSASVFSYFKGFSEYGPDYNAYIGSIEYRARTFLESPSVKAPRSSVLDLDPQMLLFLSAHDHPVFREEPRPSAPLPPGARVFLNLAEVKLPLSVEIARGKLSRLTVLLPAAGAPTRMQAEIGGRVLVLRRIHPRFTFLQAALDPGLVCYAGLLVPSLLPAGTQPVQLSIVP